MCSRFAELEAVWCKLADAVLIKIPPAIREKRRPHFGETTKREPLPAESKANDEALKSRRKLATWPVCMRQCARKVTIQRIRLADELLVLDKERERKVYLEQLAAARKVFISVSGS